MSNVNFGRTIKVNAPKSVAVKIANIANNNGKRPIEKQIRQIFYDVKVGKAYSFSFDDEKNTSYILSGKEGETYYRSVMKAKNIIEGAKNDYGTESGFAKLEAKLAIQNHKDRMHDLISKTLEKCSLNVKIGKISKDIASIDIVY